MNDLFHNQMKTLSKLGKVSVEYSDTTKKWYISVEELEIKQGAFLIGVCEHRDTIQEAVNAYIQRLIGEDVIIDAYGERAHFIVVPTSSKSI